MFGPVGQRFCLAEELPSIMFNALLYSCLFNQAFQVNPGNVRLGEMGWADWTADRNARTQFCCRVYNIFYVLCYGNREEAVLFVHLSPAARCSPSFHQSACMKHPGSFSVQPLRCRNCTIM